MMPGTSSSTAAGHLQHIVVLYRKDGCHICEIVEQMLEGLRREFDLSIRRVDIQVDPKLLAKYGGKIPVVIVDGRKTLEAPIHFADLRAALNSSSALSR